MQLLDNNRDFGIFGDVVLQVGTDAFPVEGMQAWIDKELSIVEDRSEAYVTCLPWVDSDVLVSLAALLSTELFSICRVLFDLHAKAFNFPFVIIETLAQMLLHLLYLRLLWEEIKQIFDFEDIELPDDLERLLYIDFLLLGSTSATGVLVISFLARSEKMFGNLHPEFLLRLSIRRLVSVLFSQLDVSIFSAVKCKLDSL